MPGLPDVVFVAVFMVALILGGQLTSRDGDLGWHLATGNLIIDTKSLPDADTFSHTARGQPVVLSEWLSQLMLALLYRWDGFSAVGIIASGLLAFPWAILARSLLRVNHRPLVALPLVFLGAVSSTAHWSVRPQVISWCLAAIVLLVLESHRTARRESTWSLIPIFLLWSWLHGGFLIGLLVVALHLAGAIVERAWVRARHLAAALGLALLATLANPAGLGLHRHLLGVVGDSVYLERIAEYASPNFHNALFWPFMVLLAMSIAVFARMPVPSRLTVLTLAGLSLYSSRTIPFFAIAAVPAISGAWMTRPTAKPRSTAFQEMHQHVAGGFLSVLAVLGSWLWLGGDQRFAFSASKFPVDALAVLASNPPGERIFNDYAWGGYIELCCSTEIVVFIDGRTDVFGPDVFNDYLRAIDGKPDWQAVLDGSGVDWVLIRPDSPLAQILAEIEGWEWVYADEVAVAFRRAN